MERHSFVEIGRDELAFDEVADHVTTVVALDGAFVFLPVLRIVDEIMDVAFRASLRGARWP